MMSNICATPVFRTNFQNPSVQASGLNYNYTNPLNEAKPNFLQRDTFKSQKKSNPAFVAIPKTEIFNACLNLKRAIGHTEDPQAVMDAIRRLFSKHIAGILAKVDTTQLENPSAALKEELLNIAGALNMNLINATKDNMPRSYGKMIDPKSLFSKIDPDSASLEFDSDENYLKFLKKLADTVIAQVKDCTNRWVQEEEKIKAQK